jgi:hypothetical protein
MTTADKNPDDNTDANPIDNPRFQWKPYDDLQGNKQA